MTAEEVEVLALYQKLRSPFKVANKLGLGTRAVLEILSNNPVAASLGTVSACVERYGGQGRPELVEYLVARKHPTGLWDNAEPAIRAARRAYEAGTHELTTGRDGDWLLLYSIPRKKAVKGRSNYFSVAYVV